MKNKVFNPMELIGPGTCNPPPRGEQLELWPKDEERIDTIGQNGNDGLHYGDIKHDMLLRYITDKDIVNWCNRGEDLEFCYHPFANNYELTVLTPIEETKYFGKSFVDCVKQAIIEERKKDDSIFI